MANPAKVIVVFDCDSGEEAVYIDGAKQGSVEYIVDFYALLESAMLIGRPIELHRIEYEELESFPCNVYELPDAWKLP